VGTTDKVNTNRCSFFSTTSRSAISRPLISLALQFGVALRPLLL
jgi:hypothetical protein